MLEQTDHVRYCPVCNKEIYVGEEAVTHEVCGDENTCLPPNEKHNEEDCEIVYFCSEEHLEEFKKSNPECTYVPGWKRLMGRIYRAGKSSGVAGKRQHEIDQ